VGGAGHRATGEGELALQALDLGDVGEDLHHRDDLSVIVVNRPRVDDDVDPAAVARQQHLFVGAGLAVSKGLVDDAVGAYGRAVLANLVAQRAVGGPELPPVELIGLQDMVVPVEDADEARHRGEQTLVATPGLVELAAEVGHRLVVFSLARPAARKDEEPDQQEGAHESAADRERREMAGGENHGRR